MSKARRASETPPPSTATGPIGLDASAKADVLTRNLARGQRVLLPVMLDGKGLGYRQYRTHCYGPRRLQGLVYGPIELRAPQLDVARDDTAVLGAGASLYGERVAFVADIVTLDRNRRTQFVSAAHGYSDVAGIVALFGSTNIPMAASSKQPVAPCPCSISTICRIWRTCRKIRRSETASRNAADNVLDMQNFAGNFGMWSSWPDADPWLSVFALDFLAQAKDKGYVISKRGVGGAACWLKQTSTSDSNERRRARLFLFYVLDISGPA